MGISASQWSILITLRMLEIGGHAGVRQTDLSQKLLVRPPSVTGVLDRLEKMGLVHRAESLEDHRAKLVQLTAAGRELVERIMAKHPIRVANIMAPLSEVEQRQMRSMLDRIADGLEILADRNGSVMEDTDETL